MDHLVVRGNPTQVNWTFKNIAGDPISLSGYTYRLYYSMGAATTLARGVTFVGSVLSWTFVPDDQWKLGYYDLTFEVYDEDRLMINVSYPKAFLLMKSSFVMNDATDDTSTARDNDYSTLNIVSSIDFGRFDSLPITWNKIDDNLKNIIVTGGGQHGAPFATEFGDSDQLGITQRVLTESRDDLQRQINEIVSDKATASLAASPSSVFVNEECTINLTATSNTNATSIKIKKGSTDIATGSGKSLSGSETFTPTAVGSVGYTAEFTIAGVPKTATKNVSVVKKILYGAGANYTDAHNIATARTGPAGTYNVVVSTAGAYVWLRVPDTMPNINGAKLGADGFDFPLEVVTTVDGYKIYRSSNTLDAGTYQFIIS